MWAALTTGVAAASLLAGTPPWPADSVGPAPRTAAANKRTAAKLPGRIDRSALGRNVAVSVVDTATGETVFARNANRGLAAASNTKLVAGLLALQALGPGYRSPTMVRQVSRNRIALVGGGDNLLTTGDVRRLTKRTARDLKQREVKRVRVQVDASLYRWRGPGIGWASYEVGGNIGKVEPLNMNDARTGDGPRYVGQYFTSELSRNGVRAVYTGRRASPDEAPVIARFRGHPLKAMVRASLLPSDSDHAEAIARLTATALGFEGTYLGWWRAARATIDELGIDRSGIRLYDGAGLSQRNRLTTTFITDLLLASMDRDNPRMNVLLRERRLPIAGRTGTLTTSLGRFTGSASCAQGRVFAKTGTIAGVVALSGYAIGSDNRWKVFSILVNNRPGVDVLRSRQALDRIAATVTGCY